MQADAIMKIPSICHETHSPPPSPPLRNISIESHGNFAQNFQNVGDTPRIRNRVVSETNRSPFVGDSPSSSSLEPRDSGSTDEDPPAWYSKSTPFYPGICTPDSEGEGVIIQDVFATATAASTLLARGVAMSSTNTSNAPTPGIPDDSDDGSSYLDGSNWASTPFKIDPSSADGGVTTVGSDSSAGVKVEEASQFGTMDVSSTPEPPSAPAQPPAPVERQRRGRLSDMYYALEENVVGMRYCLTLLRHAETHIDFQISRLRDLVVSTTLALESGISTMSNVIAATRREAISRISSATQAIRREVVDTLRRSIDLVGRYAANMPSGLRTRVKDFILSLPNRWASISGALTPTGDDQSVYIAQAHRVLTLANETVIMLKWIIAVFGQYVQGAESLLSNFRYLTGLPASTPTTTVEPILAGVSPSSNQDLLNPGPLMVDASPVGDEQDLSAPEHLAVERPLGNDNLETSNSPTAIEDRSMDDEEDPVVVPNIPGSPLSMDMD